MFAEPSETAGARVALFQQRSGVDIASGGDATAHLDVASESIEFFLEHAVVIPPPCEARDDSFSPARRRRAPLIVGKRAANPRLRARANTVGVGAAVGLAGHPVHLAVVSEGEPILEPLGLAGQRGGSKADSVEAHSQSVASDTSLDSLDVGQKYLLSIWPEKCRIASLAGWWQNAEEDLNSVDSLIATLNTIEVGEMDKLRARLLEVRVELDRRQLAELVEKLDESLAALSRGDLKNFRRLKESIVSRLGHLR